MTSPALPVTPNTALLGDADLHIYRLALAVDARLGSGLRYVPIAANPTIDSAAQITIPVDMGGRRVSGAVCQLSRVVKGYGREHYAPPVPPSSIGVLMPATALNIYLVDLNPGPNAIIYAVRTSIWTGKTYDNQQVWYGSQPADAGISVNVVGLCWGPA